MSVYLHVSSVVQCIWRSQILFMYVVPNIQNHLDSSHSGVKNVLQDSLEDTLESQEECLLPMYSFLTVNIPVCLETWNFAHSSFMLINVIADVQSHSLSIQKSRTSSNTPWMTLWRHKCTLMLIFVISAVQSHLDSIQVSRTVSKTSWKMVLRQLGDSPLPVHLKTWKLWYKNTLQLFWGCLWEIMYFALFLSN